MVSRGGRWLGIWGLVGPRSIGRFASERPPKYERPPVVTSFAPFEARVRALLADHPEMPASVIAERVGWTASERWFRQNVAGLRTDYRRIDPGWRAGRRRTYRPWITEPGLWLQFDWGAGRWCPARTADRGRRCCSARGWRGRGSGW